MVVIVLTACPAGLRGHLTRWLLEISPGVYVGNLTGRVRDHLWERVEELLKDGRALMVFSRRNEQGLDFRTIRHDWEPIDFDGVRLMLRRTTSTPTMRPGWSLASRRRKH